MPTSSTAALGSYKGVMLCNRPLAFEQRSKASAPGEAPFKTGIHTEPVHPLGKNDILSHALEMMPEQAKEETVIDRHKRWLKELESQRQALLHASEGAQARREEKKKRFMESQKAFRDMVRSQPPSEAPSPRASGASSPRAASVGSKPSLAEATAAAAAAMMAGTRGASRDVDVAAAAKKPAWARTEAAQVAVEDAEAADLVSFARELDYDKFVDNLDTKTENAYLSQALREVEEAEAQQRAEIASLEAATTKQERQEAKRRAREERAARAAAEGVVAGASLVDGEEGTTKRVKRRKGKGRKGSKRRNDASSDAALMAQLIAGAAGPIPDAPAAAAETVTDENRASSTVAAAVEAPFTVPAAAVAAARKEDASAAPARAGGPRFLVGGGGKPSSVEAEDEDSDEEDGVTSSVEGDEDDDSDGMETLDTLGGMRVPRHVRIRANDDASSIATSVLSSASSLRGVHSKRSLAAVIDRHMKESAAHAADALAAGLEDVPPPRIVVVHDNAGALASKKALVSQLPYQHRNPAV